MNINVEILIELIKNEVDIVDNTIFKCEKEEYTSIALNYNYGKRDELKRVIDIINILVNERTEQEEAELININGL